jgi:hypothetical protein
MNTQTRTPADKQAPRGPCWVLNPPGDVSNGFARRIPERGREAGEAAEAGRSIRGEKMEWEMF